jgi:hypothetical protein
MHPGEGIGGDARLEDDGPRRHNLLALSIVYGLERFIGEDTNRVIRPTK